MAGAGRSRCGALQLHTRMIHHGLDEMPDVDLTVCWRPGGSIRQPAAAATSMGLLQPLGH